MELLAFPFMQRAPRGRHLAALLASLGIRLLRRMVLRRWSPFLAGRHRHRSLDRRRSCQHRSSGRSAWQFWYIGSNAEPIYRPTLIGIHYFSKALGIVLTGLRQGYRPICYRTFSAPS